MTFYHKNVTLMTIFLKKTFISVSNNSKMKGPIEFSLTPVATVETKVAGQNL